MQCREGCGACCIAPSIRTPMPGMPEGKPAGVPCGHLAEDMRCGIFGRPERPAFCAGLQPALEMCGEQRTHALIWLAQLEHDTHPDRCAPQAMVNSTHSFNPETRATKESSCR